MLDKGVLTFEFEEEHWKLVRWCGIFEFIIEVWSPAKNGCELYWFIKCWAAYGETVTNKI